MNVFSGLSRSHDMMIRGLEGKKVDWVQEQPERTSLSLSRHSEEREQRMKASAYPFNASAGFSPTESSLFNNPKAGLLRCNAPRNDSKTRTLTNSVVAQPPRNDVQTLSLTHKEQGNSSPVTNLLPYCPNVLTTNRTPTPSLPLGLFGVREKRGFPAPDGFALLHPTENPPLEEGARLQCKSEQGSPKHHNEKNLVPYKKCAFTLAEGASHGAVFDSHRKIAFTLAEVLITLGIIGVVAAMTLPTLIQKNNNRVVETRLKKFYSTMNQAIVRAEADYGDKKTWYENFGGGGGSDADKNAAVANSVEQWFNKYFKPYLKITKTEKWSNGFFVVYFLDGSALAISSYSSGDWTFYPGNPQKCIEKYNRWNTGEGAGVCFFLFSYNPNYNKGVEPYKTHWDGDEAHLLSGHSYSCNTNHRGYCTALIQANGWRIPDNYPWKVSY